MDQEDFKTILENTTVFSNSESPNEIEELYDVVIIGAGLSGLNAAKILSKAEKKFLF
ncbi:hypothetical protein CLU97_2750 [Chryseobacterium sp. 7]|uniref:hypothetical protein n=1 Tax=Chryseobacterium sp. 7 TaxID=2035214 RepID=UPI000F2B25A3|nr:hypothetical protein [Chryseobacterium sp. 7]RLJ33270.1 hypothetical protein CLU97_2750 [Chryseobacterium sp. 7]